jgi:hypothetical protein
MPFDKLSLKELKEHAKQHKDLIKGYTKMGKADLVKTLNKHLKRDRSGAVSRKGDPSKTHPGDMDYTTKLGDKDYHEGGHDESEKKRPFSTMTDDERRQWKQQFGDKSLLDIVKEEARNNPIHGGRLESCLHRIHKLKGGQLPSSIRDRLEHLEMKIKGGQISSGKPKKRITLVAGQQPSSTVRPIQPQPVAKLQPVKTQGQKSEASLLDELEKRIADPNYGKDIADIQAGQKLEGEETWGKKQKDKDAEYREERKKLAKMQDKRMEDIIAKYEKQEKKSVQPRQKKDAPPRMTDKEVEETAKRAMARLKVPETKKAEKRKEPCEIRGYSKLKKAELVAVVGKALREKGKSVTGLEKETVPKLRALAREHCGYKKVTKLSEKEVKDTAEKALARIDLPVGGKVGPKKEDRCWEGYKPVEGKKPYSKGSCEKEDDIDFEDLKWGSFTEQFNAYNRQHKKKFKDLMEFAQHIRANKGDFQPKTKKRADFYVNVISKKKS